MRRAIVAFVLALTLAVASVAYAAPATWTIDPGHSRVGFSIRHFFSKVPGSFTKFSGTVVYDPEKPAASTVNAEIEAASITTEGSPESVDGPKSLPSRRILNAVGAPFKRGHGGPAKPTCLSSPNASGRRPLRPSSPASRHSRTGA